jgi:mitogen-activated protein kinase 15
LWWFAIVLGSNKYTNGVDMWLVGCFLGELVDGRSMFPGTSATNQLDRIVELTGVR